MPETLRWGGGWPCWAQERPGPLGGSSEGPSPWAGFSQPRSLASVLCGTGGRGGHPSPTPGSGWALGLRFGSAAGRPTPQTVCAGRASPCSEPPQSPAGAQGRRLCSATPRSAVPRISPSGARGMLRPWRPLNIVLAFGVVPLGVGPGSGQVGAHSLLTAHAPLGPPAACHPRALASQEDPAQDCRFPWGSPSASPDATAATLRGYRRAPPCIQRKPRADDGREASWRRRRDWRGGAHPGPVWSPHSAQQQACVWATLDGSERLRTLRGALWEPEGLEVIYGGAGAAEWLRAVSVAGQWSPASAWCWPWDFLILGTQEGWEAAAGSALLALPGGPSPPVPRSRGAGAW